MAQIVLHYYVCVFGVRKRDVKMKPEGKKFNFVNEFQFYALIVLCNMIMLLVAPSSQLIMIIIMKKIKSKRIEIIIVNLVYQQLDCFLFFRSPIPREHHCRGSAG